MRLARVITAVTAALLAVVAVALPASADTRPDSASWPDDENALSFIEWTAVFIGGTLLVFVVIWAIAAAVNSKSRHHVPTIPPAGQDRNAVEATQRMPLPAPAEDSAQH